MAGAASLASGALMVALPARMARLYGLPQRSGLIRALGVRDALVGLGLLRGSRRIALLARAASDALDAALIARDARHGRSRLATLARLAVAVTSSAGFARAAARA